MGSRSAILLLPTSFLPLAYLTFGDLAWGFWAFLFAFNSLLLLAVLLLLTTSLGTEADLSVFDLVSFVAFLEEGVLTIFFVTGFIAFGVETFFSVVLERDRVSLFCDLGVTGAALGFDCAF